MSEPEPGGALYIFDDPQDLPIGGSSSATLVYPSNRRA